MIIFHKAVLNHLPCFGKVEFVSYNLSQFHYFSIPVNYNQLIFEVFTKFKNKHDVVLYYISRYILSM